MSYSLYIFYLWVRNNLNTNTCMRQSNFKISSKTCIFSLISTVLICGVIRYIKFQQNMGSHMWSGASDMYHADTKQHIHILEKVQSTAAWLIITPSQTPASITHMSHIYPSEVSVNICPQQVLVNDRNYCEIEIVVYWIVVTPLSDAQSEITASYSRSLGRWNNRHLLSQPRSLK